MDLYGALLAYILNLKKNNITMTTNPQDGLLLYKLSHELPNQINRRHRVVLSADGTYS